MDLHDVAAEEVEPAHAAEAEVGHGEAGVEELLPAAVHERQAQARGEDDGDVEVEGGDGRGGLRLAPGRLPHADVGDAEDARGALVADGHAQVPTPRLLNHHHHHRLRHHRHHHLSLLLEPLLGRGVGGGGVGGAEERRVPRHHAPLPRLHEGPAAHAGRQPRVLLPNYIALHSLAFPMSLWLESDCKSGDGSSSQLTSGAANGEARGAQDWGPRGRAIVVGKRCSLNYARRVPSSTLILPQPDGPHSWPPLASLRNSLGPLPAAAFSRLSM